MRGGKEGQTCEAAEEEDVEVSKVLGPARDLTRAEHVQSEFASERSVQEESAERWKGRAHNVEHNVGQTCQLAPVPIRQRQSAVDARAKISCSSRRTCRHTAR